MMRSYLIFRKLFLLIFFIGVSIANSGHSQVVVTQTQALNFGTFAFSSFNSTATVRILDGGGATTGGGASIIVAPTRGEFSVSSVSDLNAIYTVTFPASFTLSGPGGNFTIDNIRVSPAILQTDGSGNDTFSIAARLSGLGGGTVYNNGTYSDTFDVTITF